MKKFALKTLLTFAVTVMLLLVFSIVSVFAVDGTDSIEVGASDGLSVSYSTNNGSYDYDAENEVITFNELSSSQPNCGSTSYTPKTATLSLTNVDASNVITFDYDTALNSGTCILSTAEGNYRESGSTIVLLPNEKITFSLTSPKSSSAVSLTIQNFNVLDTTAEYDITVIPNEGGTVTDGTTPVTSADEGGQVYTTNYLEGVSLTATPDTGYSFYGYVNANNVLLSNNAQLTINPVADMTIKPLFYKTGSAVFGVGDSRFVDLDEAGTFASNGSNKTIVLLQDGYLEGTHTVPEGTTLLIPNSTSVSPMKSGSFGVTGNPSLYRTLTLNSDSVLNVEGDMVLNTGWTNDGGGTQVCLAGAFTKVLMDTNAQINVKDGAKLYAWGYITDKAGATNTLVTAENGSEVREVFQEHDFRGYYQNNKVMSAGVFPMNQYYVQNIESKLQVNYGATVNCETSIKGQHATVALVGSGSNSALFKLNNANSTFTKWYDKTNDKLMVVVDGHRSSDSADKPDASVIDFELDAIYVNGVDSSNYVLPINNMNIQVDNGTLNINYSTQFLPDSSAVVGENAILNIPKSGVVYFIDSAVWYYDNYTFGGKIRPIKYISTGANPNKRNASTYKMKTASLEVQGLVNVQGTLAVTTAVNPSTTNTGSMTSHTRDVSAKTPVTSANVAPNVFATKDGATVRFDFITDVAPTYGCITGSSGGSSNTYCYKDEFASESVWLKNADSTYVKTNQGTAIYQYNATSGEWNTTKLYTVKWCDREGSELYFNTFTPGSTPEYPYDTPVMAKTAQYTYSPFEGWSTTPGGEVVIQPCEAFPDVTNEDVTYYAVHSRTENNYIVVFNNYDGTELQGASNPVSYTATSDNDAMIATYTGNTPERPSDYDGTDFYSTKISEGLREELQGKGKRTDYTFSYWSKSYNLDNDICTFTANYSSTDKYLEIWVNETADEILYSGYYTYYTSVDPTVYEVPVKENTEEHYYQIKGWKNLYNNSINTASGNDDWVYSDSYAAKNIFQATYNEYSKMHSLTLNGTIGVNFYYQLPSGYSADNTSVDFSWGGTYLGPQEYDYETPNTLNVNGEADGDYVKYTLPLAMKELNDTVSVTVKGDDGTVITTENYKPTDYAYKILSRDSLDGYTEEKFAQLKELVRTMLISAADAQNSFNYNTGDLATYKFGTEGFESLTTDLTPVNAEALRQLYPAEDAFSDIKFYGSALNLEDETGYTLYFTVNDPSGYSVSKADVTATTTNINGEEKALDLSDDQAVWTFYGNRRLRISMKGLAAAEITNDITLTYKGTEITVNPGEYIALALEQGSDTLKNTVTALYNYNQAAIAFFGGNNG